MCHRERPIGMTVERILLGDPDRRVGEREKEVVREAIRDTDWEETGVLDVVEYRPVARSDDPPLPEFRVERYDGEIPDYDEYEDASRGSHEVHRITEASCAEAGIDPVTGEPIEEEREDDESAGLGGLDPE